jgi:excisionase family DNA binding protein
MDSTTSLPSHRSKLDIPAGLPNDVRLLNTQDVAALLGVSPKTIRRLLDAGKLPQIVRIGRLIRWRENDIINMIRGL